ncbi:hypothetical protein HD554DRAFT_2169372 [Boletus coccyginus]|nr:hypothetical protein HD554DRAFT_2169372 [Boletus coccyginus]
MPNLRQSKRATAGQGGAASQLCRVGDALDQAQQVLRPRVAVPDDAPRNPMAPAPTQKGYCVNMCTIRNPTNETDPEDAGPALATFSNDEQISDEESENSGTNSGAGAQMDVDMNDEDESDRSKDDDSDGAQSTPQQAPQHFQQHVCARQQDAPHCEVAQRSRLVLSHQDIPPQWAASSSHIARPLAPLQIPSQCIAQGTAPSQVSKTKCSEYRAPTRNRPQSFEDGQVNVNHDVVQHHHSQNCHPHSPSPTYLMSIFNGEARPPKKKKRSDSTIHTKEALPAEGSNPPNKPTSTDKPHHGVKYSKMTKAKISARPTTLAFFKEAPLWGKLLDEAKGRMQLYLATENPFSQHEMVIDGISTEVLEEMIHEYEDNGSELESSAVLG